MIISPPSAVYRQTLTIRVAIALIMAMPILIAVLMGLTQTPISPIPLVVAALLLALTVWICIAIGKTQVSIHQEGIRRTSAFGVKEIEWKDVREYRYKLVPMYHGGGLLGAAIMAAAARRGGSRGMNLFFQLIGNDGTKVQISSNFNDANDAIGRILGQIHPAMQKKVAEQLDRGGATFGELKLSRQSVQWKNKPAIALSEVTKAEIKGNRLSIRKKDKMFDAISAPSHKVPNVLLLLETLDSLGIAKDQTPIIDPLARVR
jgi:uncharacterized protein DUF6585